ncbi:hypothetical protein ACQEVB_00920 [Pseudonocardia sp. CA-107938]|uniref:hypothetical protein n=1 Tax=Pseudonocardia sp. CA-107938 TaxID=3240021 RepID=UPI003D8F2F91
MRIMDGLGTLLTNPGHALATSALPNAPVVEEPERRPGAVRVAVAATLRSAASGIRRLADRVEPACSRRSATA